MPTPSIHEIDSRLPPFTSCPPEDDRETSWRVRPIDPDALIHDAVESAMNVETPTNLPPLGGSGVLVGPTESYTVNPQQTGKQMDIDEDGPLSESLSPVSTQDTKESSQRVAMTDNYLGSSTSTGYEASNIRLMPSAPSSFLRAGSQFKGTQQSERQVYDVQVDIKHVDMRESFLCGYLRIQGLTEDHPTLTTYFEGEIIGSKYSFLTQHEDWGSTDKVDLQHWAKFQAFRPFAKQARKGNLHIPHLAQRENIFMRWKEHFLVPDHRVRTITGASFEGFYYICFNQVAGTISGIYFHAKSEKFQQLELAHVEDRGCFSSMEFR